MTLFSQGSTGGRITKRSGICTEHVEQTQDEYLETARKVSSTPYRYMLFSEVVHTFHIHSFRYEI